MDAFKIIQGFEINYLERTISLLKRQLEQENCKLINKKKELISSRLDMYENTSHSTEDFDNASEMVQYLNILEIQTTDYVATEKRIEKNKRLLNSPYFARIDFVEDDSEKELIYIGFGNLIHDKTYTPYIYDWRAPISSLFYRYELGHVNYEAPCGIISGEVTLKRQYQISNGTLQYFFDSNVNVMDDILKKALSGNSSPKMKTIVETIQREQDIIIRDIENDLVIVQGVAGSGKTSVALHRVAFLMYQGLTSNLGVNNIVLISPNFLFGKYISNVLPELGEEHITTLTFEDIFTAIYEDTFPVKSRNSTLEKIITSEKYSEKELLKSSLEFKLSKTFLTLIDRFIKHFEYHLIEFSDIHFNGECVANRNLLKTSFLNKQKRDIPVEKRLLQIESRILNKLQELRADRLCKLESFVLDYTNHPFDSKAFARLLHSKQSVAIRQAIYKFTRIDYLELYKKLFHDKTLFDHLSKGLDLPPSIDEIIAYTMNNLSLDEMNYEDAIVLTCLKIRMSGCNSYLDFKQVVVDEAQDYYPIHYEILKMLFRNAKYTVLGDINQTIEKQANLSIYEDIKHILCKPRSITTFMTKSFRCSYEINTFSSKFIDSDTSINSFDRHDSVPQIVLESNLESLDAKMIEDILHHQKCGYTSISILCKSTQQSKELYDRISSKITVQLIDENTIDTMNGVLILPIYMAKGLEFDAVLIYQTDENSYKSEADRKLLYIASTRALHKLSLYYTGSISKLLE